MYLIRIVMQAQQNEAEGLLDSFSDLDLQTGSGEGPSEFQESPNQAWSAHDRELVSPCVGLVKAAKACLKRVSGAVKTNGKCDCGETVSQLDDVGERSRAVSPAVDDTVAALYPPVSHAAVRQNVSVLGAGNELS